MPKPASAAALLSLLLGPAAPGHALEDFPVYLDAGCGGGTAGGLNNGYAQGPADMLLGQKQNGDKTVPVTCAEKLSGSDAMGAGNPDCANYLDDNDGGWFVNRMTAAAATPIALPTVGIFDRRIRLDRARGPAFPASGTDPRDILGRRSPGPTWVSP